MAQHASNLEATSPGATVSASPSGARKRVMFVHSATLPPLGADTWMQALLIRNLDRTRYDVRAACAFGSPESRTPTFDILSVIPELELLSVNLGPELFSRGALDKLRGLVATVPAVAGLAELAVYVRRNRIEILHTSDRPRDAGACAILSRLTGAKYIVHAHVAFGVWMSPLLKRAMAGADALIGVSEFVRGSLIDAGYSAERTHAVLNSIDVDAWDYRQSGRGIREEWHIPASAPVVVCVARLFADKGHAELLRAFAIVRKEFPEARLLIVGQDYPPGTYFSVELKRLARELGVFESVHFLGRRSDVAAILAASDILAMASIDEPFGLVYAEAMAMKVPVVAFRTGGTPEVVEHEKSGLLGARGDIEGFAANLTRLIRDPSLRARMGESGRRTVETRFNPERMGKDVGRIYDSL